MALALVMICDRCGAQLQSRPIERNPHATVAACALISEGETTEHVCDRCEPFRGPSRVERRAPALAPTSPARRLRGKDT